MITNDEIETGGSDIERSPSWGKNRKDNTQVDDPFEGLFWESGLDGAPDGGGEIELIDGSSFAPTAASHVHWSEDVRVARPVEPIEPVEVEALSPTPQQAVDNRENHLAAFRKILSEVEEDPELAADPVVEQRPAPAAPEQIMRNRAWNERDERDQLDSELNDLTHAIRAAKGLPTSNGYNAGKLRRSHDTRAKNLQRAKDRREKTGGFLTGITLVSVVAAALVGLYILHPQIIATSPQVAPALNEYVVTVDRYRAETNQTASEWKEWLLDRIDRLTNKDA